MSEEIYPMPSFPTLLASDLEASANFYQNVLGFKHIFTMPGPGGQPALVHLRWIKYADLLITKSQADITGPRGVGVALNFGMFDRFNGDIDILQHMPERMAPMYLVQSTNTGMYAKSL